MKTMMSKNLYGFIISLFLLLLLGVPGGAVKIEAYTIYPIKPETTNVPDPVNTFDGGDTWRRSKHAHPTVGTNLGTNGLYEYLYNDSVPHYCPDHTYPNNPYRRTAELCGMETITYWRSLEQTMGQNYYFAIDHRARCWDHGKVHFTGVDVLRITSGNLINVNRVSSIADVKYHTATVGDNFTRFSTTLNPSAGLGFVALSSESTASNDPLAGNIIDNLSVYTNSFIKMDKQITPKNINISADDNCQVTIDLTNVGDSSASGLVLTDVIDEGFEFVPNSVKYNGTQVDNSLINYTNRILTIDLTTKIVRLGGNIEPSVSNTANVTFDLKVTKNGTWQNQAKCDYYDTGYQSRPESNYFNYSNVASVTATGEVKKYNYKVTADEGGTATPTTEGTVAQETEIAIKATPNAGYEFDKWVVVDGKAPASYGSAVTAADNKFTMPASDVHIKATFKKINYTVLAYGEPGKGTGTADKTTANMGDVVTLTATPEPGFMFVGWVDKNGNITDTDFDPTDPNATFKMPAGNVEVQATFAPIPANKAVITIKKTVVGTKGNANDIFLINLNDNSTNALITSVALKDGNTSSALTFDMGSATSKAIKVSEIIPMDYDGTKVKVSVTNQAGTATLSGDTVTIHPGDDVTIVVENTFAPMGYFKAKDFVKNIFK